MFDQLAMFKKIDELPLKKQRINQLRRAIHDNTKELLTLSVEVQQLEKGTGRKR